MLYCSFFIWILEIKHIRPLVHNHVPTKFVTAWSAQSWPKIFMVWSLFSTLIPSYYYAMLWTSFNLLITKRCYELASIVNLPVSISPMPAKTHTKLSHAIKRLPLSSCWSLSWWLNLQFQPWLYKVHHDPLLCNMDCKCLSILGCCILFWGRRGQYDPHLCVLLCL